MTEKMPADDSPKGELILYQTEDRRTRIECRFDGETVWLMQALMAELFQTTPQNITQHLREIYAERELDESATCKGFLQVRAGPVDKDFDQAIRAVKKIEQALRTTSAKKPPSKGKRKL